ncbi:hypothetical protein ARSEF1564_005396 [Beauveria bassiana]
MDIHNQNGRRSLENQAYQGNHMPPGGRARQPPPRGQSRGYPPNGQPSHAPPPMNARQPPPREQFRRFPENRQQDPAYGDYNGASNPRLQGRGNGSYSDAPNPRPQDHDYVDYSETRNLRQGPSATSFGPLGRSVTMPFQDSGQQAQTSHQRAETLPLNGHAGRSVPPRPATTTGTRPTPQRTYPQQQMPSRNAPYGAGYEPGVANSVYDEYYNQRQSNPNRNAGDAQQMGASAQPAARSSFDQPRAPRRELPHRGPHQTPKLSHAKSMADMREPQSAVFEMAGDIPSVPPMPPHTGYGQRDGPGYDQGNDQGYDLRNDQGFGLKSQASEPKNDQTYIQRNDQGYDQGYDHSYQRRDQQNNQGHHVNNQSYNQWNDQSYEPGYEQGYEQGFDQNYDQGYNHGYGQAISYDNVPPRGPSAPPAPGRAAYPSDPRSGAGAQTQPPIPQRANPDGLPTHPTPVRPGQMPHSLVNPSGKPLPIRNYGGLPRPPQQQPAQQDVRQQERQYAAPPIPSSVSLDRAQDKEPETPVTTQELEQLRMIIRTNPADQQSALRLAKRLIEAADALVPQIPDPRARVKAQDRYLMDAHKVLKKLASNQNAEAMFTLADGLGKGLYSGEPDTKEAFTLYQSAAKLGHAAAAYRTAVCCEIGHEEGGGTRRDPLKAIQWYKRAATLGDPPAMYKMGMVTLKGLLGQNKNPREAVGWLKRAAERADANNPHALHELGLLYESAQPNDLLVRDEGYALSLFQQASDLGYKFSQFRLGCAYEYGQLGCPVNPRLSIVWYSRAAMQEEHQAELALSGWYLTGSEGVLNQSDTEAYLWARKAATAGMAKAEFAMGYFTEVGIGIPPNLEDAKRWYWRAAAQEFPKARERLEELKKVGKAGPPRPRERISRSRIERQQEGDCTIM